MVSRLYFLITANNELRTFMSRYASDVAELLSETRLWASAHSDRSDWTASTRAVAVKLLYLAHLRQEYSLYEEYRSILADAPITANTFDQWWSLVPLSVDEDFESVVARLDPAVASEIRPTGIVTVDAWIKTLQPRQPVNGLSPGERPPQTSNKSELAKNLLSELKSGTPNLEQHSET